MRLLFLCCLNPAQCNRRISTDRNKSFMNSSGLIGDVHLKPAVEQACGAKQL
jgi:hypothetical protein